MKKRSLRVHFDRVAASPCSTGDHSHSILSKITIACVGLQANDGKSRYKGGG